MKNVLIVLGHPDKKSLCGELADEYSHGAKDAGAKVRRINLGDLKFDPVLWEGYHKIQKLEPDLLKAQADIKWADHLVFVYPNWWGSLPALMKGFFDRAFLPGFAYHYEKNGRITKLLKGKSARIIITMGEPWIFYELTGSLAEKILKFFILFFCGVGPTKTTIFSKAEKASKKKINNWLETVYKLGAKQK
jgi:putative NADPH-quinone reductase